MSNLVGAALPGSILQMKDRRLVPGFQVVRRQRDRISERHSPTAYPGGYTSDYWPGNLALSGGVQGFVGEGLLEGTWSRTAARLGHGAASRVGFVGVTRDAYGSPLAGVTCSLFLTATRQWIMDVVSDTGGNFLLQSWYSPDTHFIVFYKAGAPSVYASTDQILVGA